MNHIYKVVWSKVKNCYVVVSEIAHNSGKEHSSRTSHSHRKGSQGGLYALALAVALGLTSPSQADAADLGNGASATYDAKNNLVVGKDNDTKLTDTNGNPITDGQPLDTTENTKLVDGEGQAHPLTKSTEFSGSDSITVGSENHNAGSKSITIGNNTKITSKPVTYYVDANGNKTTNKRYAAWYKDANGNPTKTAPQDPNQLYTVTLYQVVSNAVAIGNGAQASGDSSIALGNGAVAEGKGAMVIGKNAKATGQYATAFGGLETTDKKTGKIVNITNTASGNSSTAFGQGAQARGNASLAFGLNTIAGQADGSGQQSVAFGENTQALGGRSVAFGENTIANYNDSVAFGNDTRALSTGATAFGNRTRALSWYSTAWGNATVAADEESTAWGSDTIAGAKLDDNGAVTNKYTENGTDKTEQMDVHGNLAYIQNGSTVGVKQMDIGGNTEKHDYVVLDGQDGNTYVRDYQGSLWRVTVSADGKTATVDTTVGDNGKVYNNNSKAGTVGSKATTTVNGTEVAITPDSVLKKAHEGSNGYNIDGYKDATAFGYSTEASGDYATAFGNDTQAKATGATTFGTTTKASGDNATAFGLSSTASGKQATAFGSSSTASGDNATAFGENSTASGEAATAFGISSNASGKNSLAALGGTASNENSIALGKDAKADNADKAVSVAIGQNAEASGAQSLAIGFGNVSEANQSSNTKYPVSATQATAKGAIAIGINTGAKGEHSVAMGSYTDAAKDSSVAIGFDTHTLSDSAVAIGSGTKAAGRYSVALGLSSIAGTETNDAKNPLDGGGSVAMGYAASAEASRSIAIGTGATAADSQFTTAVGDSTIAQAEGSVAIGAGSVATRGAGNKESTVSNDLNTGKTTITYGDEKKAYLKPDNLSTDKTSTWVSTTGAVSVGGQATYKEYDDTGKLVKKTKLLTRQITNVAAGSDDTDAVNVAQLKAAQPTVTSNDHSVTINTTTDSIDYHKIYDLKIATATLSQEKTTGDKPVENGKIAVKNPTYTGSDGNPVTNENAYVTGKSVADAINDSGFNLIASKSEGDVTGNANALIHPGDTVTIDAGKNISLTQDKGKISIATKDNLNLGSADSKDDKQQVVPGTDGSITVNGKNGSAVAINGQDGSIGLTGPKGTDGKSTSIQMSTIMSTSTLDDSKNIKTTTGEGGQQTTTTQAPRIQYKNGNTTYEVATMYDGQTYAGDVQDSNAKANAFSRKLNEQTNVVGGVTNLDDLSKANNVGVVSNGTDTLTIRLAKRLTDLTSVTTVTTDDEGKKTSETVQDGNGITITPSTLGNGKSAVSLTDNGLSNGGNQITHVDSGLKDAAGNKVELKDATGDVLNNAVNVGDLKNVQNAVTSAHTAVTVNGSVEAPDAGANGTLGNYTDKKKGNLLLAQKKDSTGKITYDLKLNDKVVLGKAGKDGIDGSIGLTGADGKSSIGLNGKDGISVIGKDGQNGVSITGSNGLNGENGIDGKIAIGTPGKDGQPGKDAVSIFGKDGVGHIGLTGPKGADGKDGAFTDLSTILGAATLDRNQNEVKDKDDSTKDKASRIQYQTTVKEADGTTKTITHEVATMDDGLKFAGDDVNTTVAKKLNSTLQIRGDGTYDKDKNTVADDGNIKTSVDNGAVKVSLSDKINLHQDGYLTVGGDKNGDAADGNDPILIKHFDDKTLDVITGVDKEGKPIIAKVNKAGDYVTGLDNKDWNVDKPEYVSGRAATEDQLKTISDAVKEAATTAGRHTVITVENGKAAGTTDYNGENLKLKVTEKDGQKTYDLKLNDKVTLGKDGVDGSIGLKGADGKSSIGLNGKDGISVIGKDGKNGVSITGSNGLNGIDGKIAIGTPGKDGQPGKDAVSISGQNGKGHIGLTGSAGKDGKDASADIHVKNGQVGVDGTDGHGGKDGMDRVVYEDHNHITHEVATMDDGMKYAGDFGKGASVKLNKTVKVKGNAKKEADLTDGNIGVVSSQSGDDGQLLIKLNKDINLGNNGSVKMGNTIINNDGMTISKTESGKTTTVTLTDKGLNNGGNKITNVAAGTDGTDAVNVSQLNDVKHLAEQHTTVEAGPSGNVKVTSGTNADGSKKYTVDLAKDVTFGNAGNGDKTVAISGTDGTVTAGTGDNKVTVDGSKGQIVAGGDNGVKVGNIADGDSSLTIYDKDGKATGKTDKAGKYVTNLDNKTWNQDGSYVSGRAATEDQLHQVESNVNTKIDNVDKHHTEVTVNGGTAAKADGSYTDGNLQLKQTTGKDGQKIYDLKLNDQIKVGQKGEAGKDGENGNVTVETKGGTTVVLGHDGKDGKDGRDGLFVTGKDGKDGKSGISITGPNGVAGRDGVDGKVGIAGKDGRDAVSIAGRDGVGHIGLTGPKGADGKDGQNASADIHVKNGQVGVDGTDGHGGKDGMDRVVYEDHNGTSHEVATMDDGMKYSGDSGNAAVKLNNKVQLYGGAKEYAAGDNIGVVVSQDGDNAKMQVKLAKDLKGIDSIDAKTVTTGNTTINNSGLTVKGDDKHKDITVQQGSVNMGGNKIEGVAPGKVAPDSTEAINGSQLAQRDQAIGKLGGEVSSLDRRVDRVGAGAAALAALHPQDFDPDDKWDFAVGYGNYRGANAAAVGAFYRPNEDTTLSVGGTVGGGENMVNAGISFKFGQGNHVTNSRVAMAKEILALKDYVQKQDEKIEKLEALVGQQGTAAAPKRRSILFPDVPENHWAYAYVKKLADRGLLEGYPDGEFKGDRTITRYEFAAIFSRALENGASVDNDLERMSEEFEPEIRELSLNRFRVDRVEGKDNDRHKIERVRVNDRDELVKQKNGEQKKRYRDVYGSVIEKDAPADAAK